MEEFEGRGGAGWVGILKRIYYKTYLRFSLKESFPCLPLLIPRYQNPSSIPLTLTNLSSYPNPLHHHY